MPVFLLLFWIVLIIVVFAFAIWGLGKLAPAHPPVFDAGLWVLCGIIILVLVLNALGVGFGPTVPRLGGH